MKQTSNLERANLSSYEVVGTGFTVLDRIYEDSALFEEAIGGSCGNVLVSLSMLDRVVAPVLSLGEDETGKRLLGEFKMAGADARFINLRRERQSPVVLQQLDTFSGIHRFSFTCHQTMAEFPRYEPIESRDVVHARPALSRCCVFYADRLSESILDAMGTAHSTGAIIYFEPSEIERNDLFEHALRMVTILKFSAERLGREFDGELRRARVIVISTHGADGLELSQGADRMWCNATRAPNVKDTCGSGDMLSVGLIDWLLGKGRQSGRELGLHSVLQGIIAGQRLAAANCAYIGARGVFRQAGVNYARRVLEGCAT